MARESEEKDWETALAWASVPAWGISQVSKEERATSLTVEVRGLPNS